MKLEKIRKCNMTACTVFKLTKINIYIYIYIYITCIILYSINNNYLIANLKFPLEWRKHFPKITVLYQVPGFFLQSNITI